MKRKWKLIAALTATVLWLWFIFSRSAKPAPASQEESAVILELLRHLVPTISLQTVRKLAHFTEFFILGGLLYLDWRLLGRGQLLLPLAAGLIAAAADETLQIFVPGRSGEVRDVMLDFAGVAAAVGGLLLLRRRRERKRHGSGT